LPSLISHAVVGLAAGVAFSPEQSADSFVPLCIISSTLSDIDGLAFALGIPYNSFFGHRGFFHSITFALILSLLIMHICFPYIKPFTGMWFYYETIFFMLSVSHGILDAMTEGGKGVAFFSPFSQKRYLFPWKPMIACPLTIGDFFSEWGKIAVKSELVWIWLPSFALILLSLWLKGG